MATKDFRVTNLRGGLNDTLPPNALPDNQVVSAENVEWIDSMLGERRRGASAITVGGNLASREACIFLHRHVPAGDESAAQLFALGLETGGATSTLSYKTSSWSDVTPSDAIVLTGSKKYEVRAQSLDSKMFLAYDSTVDRLHVWDGTSLRRCGMKPPAAAPTGADTGSGTFSGTRYYRVRFTVQSSGVTLRRSEPSTSLSFSPSGSGSAARVTKPATTSEDETHWELEASLDNVNFYVIATTVVGTTTYDDSQDLLDGYARSFELSPDIGDYTVFPSVEYLVADQDRIIGGGSHEDTDDASSVIWTPVGTDPGDGNNERYELDQDSKLRLDPGENGGITGLAAGFFGQVYAFKVKGVYQLIRTGQRAKAYRAYALTKARGAIKDSVVTAIDQNGDPAIYFLDRDVGPCRIDKQGIRTCGSDIWGVTWRSVNPDATINARAIYYPAAKQIHWWIPTGAATVPNLRIVLQTNEQWVDDEGNLRGGWSRWSGESAYALTACLGPTNIESNTTHGTDLVPFIGVDSAVVTSGVVWQTDTGTQDNATDFTAQITTKPYASGNNLNKFGVMNGHLLAKAVADTDLDVSLIRDYGVESGTAVSVTFDPDASETQKLVPMDDLSLSELGTVQVKMTDPATPGARWELNELVLKLRTEQMA